MCLEWVEAHFHGSFVDNTDKAEAHRMAWRASLGKDRQETSALRPRGTLECNGGQLLLGTLPNCLRKGIGILVKTTDQIRKDIETKPITRKDTILINPTPILKHHVT